eukprot:4737533-Amphidinium_carterae.2
METYDACPHSSYQRTCSLAWDDLGEARTGPTLTCIQGYAIHRLSPLLVLGNVVLVDGRSGWARPEASPSVMWHVLPGEACCQFRTVTTEAVWRFSSLFYHNWLTLWNPWFTANQRYRLTFFGLCLFMPLFDQAAESSDELEQVSAEPEASAFPSEEQQVDLD